MTILQKELEDLRKQNAILSISNQNDLNTKVLTLDQKIVDLNQEIEKLQHKLQLRDQKIQNLEQELDFARNAVEAESEDREITNDLSKECLRLKLEKERI